MTADPVAHLRLARTDNVGPRTYRALLRRYGTAEAALDALPGLAARGGRRRGLKPPPADAIEAELDRLERMGARCLVVGHDGYPPLLAEIYDPPPVITVLGRIELLAMPQVALVGSRNASAGGRAFAEGLARDLGERGYGITSGLARGIDAAAHQGALETGTIAVLAGGIDSIYPPENEALYRSIGERGALVSDQPLGLDPRSGHFPRRNRIVAGLSLATAVVEANARSGALITARLAAENGRDVFAVPGSPRDPRAKGPNRLIRDGAGLIEDADDIIAALETPGRTVLKPPATDVPELPFDDAGEPIAEPAQGSHERLLEALGSDPVEVDELVRRCQVTPAEAQILLLELELAGRIERHPGNKIALS